MNLQTRRPAGGYPVSDMQIHPTLQKDRVSGDAYLSLSAVPKKSSILRSRKVPSTLLSGTFYIVEEIFSQVLKGRAQLRNQWPAGRTFVERASRKVWGTRRAGEWCRTSDGCGTMRRIPRRVQAEPCGFASCRNKQWYARSSHSKSIERAGTSSGSDHER